MTEALQKAVEALEPCPWCGCAEHLTIQSVGVLTVDMPDRPYRVICTHIDHDTVTGPVAYGRRQAIDAWNRRAALAEPDYVAMIMTWLRERQNLVGVWDGRAIADAIERRAYLPATIEVI